MRAMIQILALETPIHSMPAPNKRLPRVLTQQYWKIKNKQSGHLFILQVMEIDIVRCISKYLRRPCSRPAPLGSIDARESHRV